MDGKGLEKWLQDSCKAQGIDCTRLRDAGWQGEATQRRFTIKNICDFILFGDGAIIYAECKHAKERLEISRLTQQKALCDKLNQMIMNLFAGYIVHIKGETYFISAAAIDKFSKKKSINAKDAAMMGIKIGTFTPPRARKPRLDIGALILELKHPF